MYYRCHDIERFINAFATISAFCFVIALFIKFWFFIIIALLLLVVVVYLVSLTKSELDKPTETTPNDPRGYNTRIEDLL